MLDLFIVVVCLVINAFFSAYEMAFVTVSKEDIEAIEERRTLYLRLNLFKRRPERTLSVIQIGITLVGAIAAAVGGTGAVESLEPYFVSEFGFSKGAAEAVAVTVVILPLTYLSVVFGELFPKTLALRYPMIVLRLGTQILAVTEKFLSPIVTFLEISTNFLLKLVGLRNKPGDEELMSYTIDIGSLPGYHQKFVENLVAMKSKRVSRTMTPWHEVAYLNFSDTEEEVRAKLARYPHTRFPVIDADTVVGVLSVKDMFENHSIPWEGLLRPALTVSPTEKVLDAFRKMQEKRTPIAIVTDGVENAFVGILTIEDALEEIVGDIHDIADVSTTSRILSERSKKRLTKNLL